MKLEPRWIEPAAIDWPERLNHLEHPPRGFWQLGGVGPSAPSVAVVGSRRATFGGAKSRSPSVATSRPRAFR
jgi:predicted Rossmann fold nucleotide-binding protein DprA/Smf involved in DNA uptake